MPSVEASDIMPNGTSFALKAATVRDHGIPKLAVTAHRSGLDIIDIRRVAVEASLKSEVVTMFHCKDGPRKLPTLLLYDERGLQLFEGVRLFSCLSHGWRAPR